MTILNTLALIIGYTVMATTIIVVMVAIIFFFRQNKEESWTEYDEISSNLDDTADF